MILNYAKICIATQHPAMGGGIGRMVENFSNYLIRNKYKLRLIFSTNPLPNLFFNESVKNKIRHHELIKNALITKTYLPFYYPNYLLFGKIMKKKLNRFNICHQIGGNCLEATPFLKAKRKFICWTATTFLDEWKTVLNLQDTSRFASWCLRTINNFSLSSIRKLEKKIYQKATKINPISTRTANMIKKEFNIKEEKIKIIPPPTDFTQFISNRESKLKQDFDYLIFVGRLDKRKNLEVLFKAFCDVNRKLKKLKLVIIGDGPERENLEKFSNKIGIRKNIVFTGFVNDKTKIDYLSQAKLLTLSSTQEGFGIVLVESLALRVPVVSTDCGGPSDIVENGKSGYLTKVGDHKELADKIFRLLIDDNLRKEFGKYGKRSVMNKFSIEKIGGKVVEEYKEIVE